MADQIEIETCRLRGTRIEQEMKRLGLTRTETARRCGFGCRTLTRIMSEPGYCPAYDKAVALSLVLQVAPEELLDLEIKVRPAGSFGPPAFPWPRKVDSFDEIPVADNS